MEVRLFFMTLGEIVREVYLIAGFCLGCHEAIQCMCDLPSSGYWKEE